MSDADHSESPRSRRDAAMKILLGEMHELFVKAETLTADVHTVDGNIKESARAVNDAARAVRQAAADLHAEPPPSIIPPPQTTPWATAIVAGVVAGLVTGAIVAGAAYAIAGDRDAAKLGRAVQSVFPTLDAETRDKLQSAVQRSSR